MRDAVKVLKAVGDRNRLRIIKMLEQKKMCVCEISAVLQITQPSVSKHLSILKDAGLIHDERSGQWIDYSLCSEHINRYAPVMQDVLHTWLNDDRQILDDREVIKTLCREELCKK